MRDLEGTAGPGVLMMAFSYAPGTRGSSNGYPRNPIDGTFGTRGDRLTLASLGAAFAGPQQLSELALTDTQLPLRERVNAALNRPL